MMIRDAFRSIFEYIARDEVLDRIEAGRMRVSAFELRSNDVVDIDAIFSPCVVGQVIQFGLDDPNDTLVMYEGLKAGRYSMQIGMTPRARVAAHTHRRGNTEYWTILKGSLTVLTGANLDYRRVYRAGETFHLAGDVSHAFLAGDDEVEAYLSFEKKLHQ